MEIIMETKYNIILQHIREEIHVNNLVYRMTITEEDDFFYCLIS